jgi:CS domain
MTVTDRNVCMYVLLHCNVLQSLRQQLLELNKQRAAASQSVTAAAALHTTAAAQLARAQSQAAAAGATVDAATAKLPQQVTAASSNNNANSRPPVVALSALQRGLSWQQTVEDLSVYLKLPRALKASQVKVDIQSAALIARIAPAVHSGVSAKQQPQGELLLRGRLWGRIASSDSTWWLEDSGAVLCFNLQKHHLQHTEKWECLFKNSEWEGGLHWSCYGNSSSSSDSSSIDDSNAATTAAAGSAAGGTAAAVDATAGVASVSTAAADVDATATGSDAVSSVNAAAAPNFTIAAELVEAAAQAAATELAVTATSADVDTEKVTIADEPTAPIVRAVSAMTAELQCSAADTTNSSSNSNSSNALRLCVKYTLQGGCSDDRDYIAAYPCDSDSSTSVSEIDETTYDYMEYLPDTAVGQCSGSVTLTLPAEAKVGAVYTVRYIAVQSSSDTTESASAGASNAVQHVVIRGVPHAAGIGAAVYTVAATKHAESSTIASSTDTSSSVSGKLVYRAPAKWLLEQQVCTVYTSTIHEYVSSHLCQ